MEKLSRRDVLTLAPAAALAATLPAIAAPRARDPHGELWEKRNALMMEAMAVDMEARNASIAGASYEKVRSIEDRANEIICRSCDVERLIFRTPVKTRDGLRVQLELAQQYAQEGLDLEDWETAALCKSVETVLAVTS